MSMPRVLRRSPIFLPVAFATLMSATSPSDSPWGKSAIEAYLERARARTLAACAEKGLQLPAGFVAWVDGDPVVRASVYGCRKDPLPVLLALRSLEIEVGEQLVRRDYPQLAIAFAIQNSYLAPRKKASGWNDGDGKPPTGQLPDITLRPRTTLRIPTDPRIKVDTKDQSRELDRDDHIVNFLEDHEPIEVEVNSRELPPLEYDDKGVAKPRGKARKVTRKELRPLLAADVVASAALQREFNDYMAAHGMPEVSIDCGDNVVHWKSKAAVRDKDLRKRIRTAHDMFHEAYRRKGRMPKERDRAPTPAESFLWFVRNDRHVFSAEDRKQRKWPRFPLNAPWPVLLMLVADDQPLREREEIWTKFRDKGEFRTYGEYIGGIAQQFDMQSARRIRPFAFSYGSIQMMWKDGGVCGTMGNIGARTFRICGVPSSTAGQPGHCAIVRMDHDPKTGRFRCRGGQYATGGDEVTTVHAGWNYDDKGGRRKMVFHQTVAWGVNEGLAHYVDSLVLQRMFQAADVRTRKEQRSAFVRAAMKTNAFALPAIEAAIQDASSGAEALEVFDTFAQSFQQLPKPQRKACGLYFRTVRDMAHGRVLALPAPKQKAAHRRLLVALERQDCRSPKLIARCWRALDGEVGFARRCATHIRDYLGMRPKERTKHRADELARWLATWARTVKRGEPRKAWASRLLKVFAGQVAIHHRGKPLLDPAVAALCRLAEQEPPTIEK